MSSGNRDFYAGALMMLIGLGACLEGLTYKLGTLTHMGPGFFPVALGVILVVLGMLDHLRQVALLHPNRWWRSVSSASSRAPSLRP